MNKRTLLICYYQCPLVHKTVRLDQENIRLYLLCQGHVSRSVLLGMCLHQDSHLGLAGDYWVLQLSQSGERSSRYRYDDLEINIFEVIKYMRAFLRKLFSVTLTQGSANQGNQNHQCQRAVPWFVFRLPRKPSVATISFRKAEIHAHPFLETREERLRSWAKFQSSLPGTGAVDQL